MRSRGFTLVEILVALGLLALVAVLAYRGVASLVDGETRLTAEARRWRTLDAVLARMESDVRQAVPRAARVGSTMEPAWLARVESQGRGGLLTHASVLAVTSYPTRTSPVVRGAWILENLLNAPPPPPPPDVPNLDSSNEAASKSKLSLRQQLEKHRSNARCAVCHNRIDPLGFALEGFDIIGKVRRVDDSGQPVETAVLPSGEKVQGVEGLKKILVGPRKEQFLSCLTEKMMIYALGRGPDPADVRTIQAVVDALARNQDRSRGLRRARSRPHQG